MSYCVLRGRPRLGDTKTTAAAVVGGAASGAPGGPVGMVIGGATGLVLSKTGKSSGDTHQGGPGSWSYWNSQLLRLQAVMKNPANKASVRQAASDLAERYKALDKGDAIKGAYPAIPEEQIAALEGSAEGSRKTLNVGSDSKTWLIVAGVALALVVAGGVLYATRKKKRR